jgi:hypothetical protein
MALILTNIIALRQLTLNEIGKLQWV